MCWNVLFFWEKALFWCWCLIHGLTDWSTAHQCFHGNKVPAKYSAQQKDKNRDTQTKSHFLVITRFYIRQFKISHIINDTTVTQSAGGAFFLAWLTSYIILQVQVKTGSDPGCLSLYVPVKFKMFTLTKIFPQIGWAVPTASLAYLPLLTTDDEFHTWGALPQVQMGKGWAGNRYHKQRAMLSVPFRLTYFSTRNSSTQVSASNPVLLFHCSCHRTPDRRRKRGEHGTGGRCTRFTWALPLLLLLSHHITELLKAQSSAFWELSLWRTACVNNFLIMMAYPVNCSNWSEELKCL